MRNSEWATVSAGVDWAGTPMVLPMQQSGVPYMGWQNDEGSL